MRPVDAFEVCHDVYCAARLFLDEKIPTVSLTSITDDVWRPRYGARLAEYAADFALAGLRALGEPRLASRLILFRVYYLGGAEYRAARKHLGISELTWTNWAEEIRERVGRELLRVGVYPPRRYFGEPSEVRPERATGR